MKHSVDAMSAGENEQGVPDTIELELSTSEIRKLSDSALPKQDVRPVLRLPPLKQNSFKLILGISGAALALVGGVAYLTASALPSRSTPAPNASPSLAIAAVAEPAKETPVRFANPFDPKEVFEFPAGTSKPAARDAVAEILIERARTRR